MKAIQRGKLRGKYMKPRIGVILPDGIIYFYSKCLELFNMDRLKDGVMFYTNKGKLIVKVEKKNSENFHLPLVNKYTKIQDKQIGVFFSEFFNLPYSIEKNTYYFKVKKINNKTFQIEYEKRKQTNNTTRSNQSI